MSAAAPTPTPAPAPAIDWCDTYSENGCAKCESYTPQTGRTRCQGQCTEETSCRRLALPGQQYCRQHYNRIECYEANLDNCKACDIPFQNREERQYDEEWDPRRQCTAICKSTGVQCLRQALSDESTCLQHSPDYVRTEKQFARDMREADREDRRNRATASIAHSAENEARPVFPGMYRIPGYTLRGNDNLTAGWAYKFAPVRRFGAERQRAGMPSSDPEPEPGT